MMKNGEVVTLRVDGMLETMDGQLHTPAALGIGITMRENGKIIGPNGVAICSLSTVKAKVRRHQDSDSGQGSDVSSDKSFSTKNDAYWNGIRIEMVQEKMDFGDVVLQAAKKRKLLKPGEYRIVGKWVPISRVPRMCVARTYVAFVLLAYFPSMIYTPPSSWSCSGR